MIDIAAQKYTEETVLSVKRWSDTLFSFTLTRPQAFKFTAGQFARIGIAADACEQVAAEQSNPDNQDRIFRAYSVVSSPFAEALEFFSVVVPNGAFTSRLQHIQAGDTLFLEKMPYGFLTLSRFQAPEPKNLWLMATGTGLAPFLSMLQSFDVWQDYEQIVLVYSARSKKELAYVAKINQLKAAFGEGGASFYFVPVVTRESVATSGAVFGERMTQLLADGSLAKAVPVALDATSHVMLCGNPQMVEDTKNALKAQGLTMNRRGEGNIAVENYW